LLSTVDGGVDLEVGNFCRFDWAIPRENHGENGKILWKSWGKHWEKPHFLRENVGNHMGKA
jgi:hypothetical protein